MYVYLNAHYVRYVFPCLALFSGTPYTGAQQNSGHMKCTDSIILRSDKILLPIPKNLVTHKIVCQINFSTNMKSTDYLTPHFLAPFHSMILKFANKYFLKVELQHQMAHSTHITNLTKNSKRKSLKTHLLHSSWISSCSVSSTSSGSTIFRRITTRL